MNCQSDVMWYEKDSMDISAFKDGREPWAKDCRSSVRAAKEKIMYCLLEASVRNTTQTTLKFSTVRSLRFLNPIPLKL